MSEDIQREILHELQKINQRLEALEEQRSGLSTPMKFVALFLGFSIIGPALFILFTAFF